MSFTIRRATHEDKPDWLRMRQGLWPDAPIEYLDFDLDDRLADPDYAVFIASNADGERVAFIEAGTPRLRRRLRDLARWLYRSPGMWMNVCVGRNLAKNWYMLAEGWAREKGATEMASDTWLENEASIAAHLKLGYEEVERLVHFVKRL